MLAPLSPNLLKDLNESQSKMAISLLEKSNILDTQREIFPTNIILDPSGKAILKLQNNKSRVGSIYEVMEVLQEIISMATTTMKPSWLNNDRLIIQRPIINVESENPALVFKVEDGKPGAAGSGPVNAPSRRMVTPLLLGRYIDPNDDSSEIYLYGQRFDYNICISVYGKTAHEADILKEWIVDIIKIYLWYVRYSGVLDFTFVEEHGDETEALRHKRTIKYAVSIEKLTWSSFFALKEFILKLSLD
jgi:hypothetical protein